MKIWKMRTTKMKNDDFLMHYASKYYDPVKAHEYYMRTRELKGRRSSSKLSDEGKEVWSYTKNQITTSKKQDVENEKNKRDVKIQQLRDKANQTRESITQKLKALNESLSVKVATKRKKINDKRDASLEEISESSKKERESISEKKNKAIEALKSQPIPEGISKEQRSRLIAERNIKIAKLRSDAKTETAKVNERSKADKTETRNEATNTRSRLQENAKAKRSSNYEKARAKREKVASQLKSTIQAAREAYKVAKTSLNTSYEKIYQQEYDKILSEYAKTSKR